MAVDTGLPQLTNAASWEEFEQFTAALQIWIQKLQADFNTLQGTVGSWEAVTITTRANAPTALGPAAENRLFYITDFAHFVRWTGTTYEFMDGGNQFIANHAEPPGTGWALCNGASINAMTVGTALKTTPITLPNLSASPSYLKAGNAYSGSIVAAVVPTAATEATHTHTGPSHTHVISGASGATAPDVTGNTGATAPDVTGDTGSTAPDVTGSTANAGTGASAHRHGSITVDDNNDGLRQTVMNYSDPDAAHSHTADGTLAVASHSHSDGTLSVASHSHSDGTLSVASHTHAAGTYAADAAGTGATGAGSAHTHTLTDGDHRHLVVLPYFRL